MRAAQIRHASQGISLDDQQWIALIQYARGQNVVMAGHHNTNHVVGLPAHMAGWFNCPPGTVITVRARKCDALPLVIRTWPDEGRVLDAVGPVLSNVPQRLAGREDTAVHSYVEGVSLSDVCPHGEAVDREMIRALAGQLAKMTRVAFDRLPALPGSWTRLRRTPGESKVFLKTLAQEAERQIWQPNWSPFGGLFASLGVREGALTGFVSRVPDLQHRPFSLLHGDLHRDNVIVPSDVLHSRLICVDWELATYGDPLHDLATHLVRMRYPRGQWSEVIASWCAAMESENSPESANGVHTDLQHYIDFERAQSVFPDVIRAVRALDWIFSRSDLELAGAEVHRALSAAAEPLGLRGVLTVSRIEQLLHRWWTGRGGALEKKEPGAPRRWTPDRRVALPNEFGESAVEEVLRGEALASARQVEKAPTHLVTVVQASGIEVVVRRKLTAARPNEPRFLQEHQVLLAIEQTPGAAGVRAPRVLALGESDLGDRFTIHTHVGSTGAVWPPGRSASRLSAAEADDLVDQLCGLAEVDPRPLDQDPGGPGFYRCLTGRLVRTVRDLPPASAELVRRLGLPGADRLKSLLEQHDVEPRARVLLHGDLNPRNLVRHKGEGRRLALTGWEAAMVGDPLHDLVRHIHLTPTTDDISERLFRRWSKRMPPHFTCGWERDRSTYRGIEAVRSAYVDLDRLVTGEGLDAPNALGTYARTLGEALEYLGVDGGGQAAAAGLYLVLALPGAGDQGGRERTRVAD